MAFPNFALHNFEYIILIFGFHAFQISEIFQQFRNSFFGFLHFCLHNFSFHNSNKSFLFLYFAVSLLPPNQYGSPGSLLPRIHCAGSPFPAAGLVLLRQDSFLALLQLLLPQLQQAL